MTTAQKKTRKNPDLIRVGDRVQIVVPEFFVRCGYPMDFHTETFRVRREHEKSIMSFLVSQGVAPKLLGGEPQALDKVARAIAYELCKQKRFGGRERKIYRESLPQHAGHKFTVQAVRFVKTGTYTLGGTSYDGEYDPPFLSNEKTHRILETNLWREIDDDDPRHGRSDYIPWIEAVNVLKISETGT